MPINPMAISLRAKKLGVLIRDARMANRKTLQECAEALGISSERFEQYEMGEESPSLPELEILAFYLEVPLDHFWGDRAISETDPRLSQLDLDQLLGLRQRIIGARLRKLRMEAGIDERELAELASMTKAQLDAYELGEQSIPLPELEALATALEQPLKDFQDQQGPIGDWVRQQYVAKHLMELPVELQAFISRPVNRPYIELAQRLSEMEVDRLRAVAEGLLEITL